MTDNANVNGDFDPELLALMGEATTDTIPLLDPVEAAATLFRTNARAAAQQIVDISLYSQNERLKLDASKYITERVLGPVSQPLQGAKNPIRETIEGLISEAEYFANTQTSGE